MPRPTLRSLAKNLQLSHATVSAALRDSPLVAARTKKKVQAVARAAGYTHNPLVGAVMSELRRSHDQLFRGVIAALVLDEPGRPSYGNIFFDAQIKGSRDRAAELGFKLEVFTVGNSHLSIQRFESILQARNISGLVLMPAWWNPNLSALDWSRYAGVYADYGILDPPLHSVCPDHYRAMSDALARLQKKGYRRAGLFIRQRHNDRLQYRWEAALLVAQDRYARFESIPSLIGEEITRDKFMAWFRRYKPDVVIGHQPEAMTWMRACGAKIPATHGFFLLNLVMATKPMAGFNQQPTLIGAQAIDTVTAQLFRNERGIVHPGALTTIPCIFVDGPTLRSG